jgi:hypothetical protein
MRGPLRLNLSTTFVDDMFIGDLAQDERGAPSAMRKAIEGVVVVNEAASAPLAEAHPSPKRKKASDTKDKKGRPEGFKRMRLEQVNEGATDGGEATRSPIVRSPPAHTSEGQSKLVSAGEEDAGAPEARLREAARGGSYLRDRFFASLRPAKPFAKRE